MSTEISGAIDALMVAHPQARPDGAWDEELGAETNRALAQVGWLGVGLAPRLGGQGGDLADAAAVVEAVSAHGWPSPAADLLLVTNSLLAHAQAVRPGDGICAVVPTIAATDGAGRVSVRAPWVPWAPWAESLLLIVEDNWGEAALACVEAARAEVRPRHNLAGAPWGEVSLADAPSSIIGRFPQSGDRVTELVMGAGALARSIQVCAALERVRDLAVVHAQTRIQFGRPLANFQAVQQNLALLAGVVAAARAAVRQATRGLRDPLELADNPRLAVAKVQTSVAANEAARLAHQIHGAMGITREHELHRYTLTMLGAREEFGTEFWWAGRLATVIGAARDSWEWLCDIAEPGVREESTHV